jgi:glycosyltransferase involved in cell wall biosynthesis
MEREISPLRDLGALIRLVSLLRRLQPAITNVGTPKAGLLVGLAAWFNRVPCRLYTMRGLRMETTTGLKKHLLGITEWLACAAADRVVCVSPSLRRRAIELRLVRAEKAVVLASGSSNGVGTARFAATPDLLAQAAEIRRRIGVASGGRLIGYVGRFTRDKGLDELIAAFCEVRQRLPGTVVMLIGEFEAGDPVEGKTRKAVDSDPGIVVIGMTTDVAPYYHAMDVFVLPTHREGFPNTVLEAQAAGKPVVTTFATGAVDSIVDGVTGVLVPVGDVAALASAVERVLSSPELAQRLGQAGRERVLREFTHQRVWTAMAEEYAELLRTVGLERSWGSHEISEEVDAR